MSTPAVCKADTSPGSGIQGMDHLMDRNEDCGRQPMLQSSKAAPQWLKPLILKIDPPDVESSSNISHNATKTQIKTSMPMEQVLPLLESGTTQNHPLVTEMTNGKRQPIGTGPGSSSWFRYFTKKVVAIVLRNKRGKQREPTSLQQVTTLTLKPKLLKKGKHLSSRVNGADEKSETSIETEFGAAKPCAPGATREKGTGTPTKEPSHQESEQTIGCPLTSVLLSNQNYDKLMKPIQSQSHYEQIQNLVEAFDTVESTAKFSSCVHVIAHHSLDTLRLVEASKHTQQDQDEIHAILANATHREFYLSMLLHLRSATEAMDNLSRGLLTTSNNHRDDLLEMLHSDGGIEGIVLKTLGTVTQTLVSQAIKAVPFPGAESASSFFEFLCSLAQSHEESKSFVRVSTFCSLCDAVQKTDGGRDAVLERMARLTVRLYNATGEIQRLKRQSKTIGTSKKLALHAMGVTKGCNTPTKEGGYKAAQQMIRHISNPKMKHGSVLSGIYKGTVRDTAGLNLSSLVVAEAFDKGDLEVENLPPIQHAASMEIIPDEEQADSPRVNETTTSPPTGFVEVRSLRVATEVMNQPGNVVHVPATDYDETRMEVSTLRDDITNLQQQMSNLGTQANPDPRNNGNVRDFVHVGGGLALAYADPLSEPEARQRLERNEQGVHNLNVTTALHSDGICKLNVSTALQAEETQRLHATIEVLQLQIEQLKNELKSRKKGR